MIYLVTKKVRLIEYDNLKIIDVEESLKLLGTLSIVGVDTETKGLDCHTGTLLSLQLGCLNWQIVIDCETIDIRAYKTYLESDRLFLFWNARFDLKWLYNLNIVPRRVYDGFLAEKLLWLGYPIVLSPEMWFRIQCNRYDYVPKIKKGKKTTKDYYILYMNLKKAGEMYLGIELDKTIRGQILYKGLTDEVIEYAALDVKYLEEIYKKQLVELDKKGLLKAIDLENRFILSLAYMEWCGVKLDIDKWKKKMEIDNENYETSIRLMNEWLIKNVPDSPYIYVDKQGNLFTGFDLTPKVSINWNSTKQVIPIFKQFGVDVEVIKDDEDKESIDAKILSPQKDKCSLIPLYLEYKEYGKIVSTYGKNVLDQVNKNTGRFYTNYNPIGTDTARISSGGKDKVNRIKYINMLNIPSDAETRACFTAEKGYKWISIDYSGQESFIMADTANDEAMIHELTYGEKDLHTLVAKIVFPKIPKDMSASEVKKHFHDERSESKGYEFAFNKYTVFI